MAYTTIDDPSAFFQAKTYTGNGSTQSITLNGLNDMQPDWVWVKQRGGTTNHKNSDSVRGATKALQNNATDSEATDSDGITSFDSNGFSLGAGGDYNGSSNTQVAWCWKAGTSFSNDASATGVGSIDSSGSVNTTAGFSIITYSGTDGTATVAHGLGVAPDFIWFKRRNANKNNTAYHSALGNTYSAYPDNTSVASTDYDYFADTSPTSSVFTVKKDADYDETNASGGTYVAWCFAEKQGYSKFGSYVGNGEITNGAFVYLGFKPAFILLKKHDAASYWSIMDNKRPNSFNTIDATLKTNVSDAESDIGDFDFLSNGFKIYANTGNVNGSGSNYIYMAFAENPFVTSTGVPTTAR